MDDVSRAERADHPRYGRELIVMPAMLSPVSHRRAGTGELGRDAAGRLRITPSSRRRWLRQNGVELPGVIWLARTDPDAAAGERGPCRAGMLASVRGHRLCSRPAGCRPNTVRLTSG